MGHAVTLGVSRVRDGSTWFAVFFVLLLHAVFLLWLLASRWGEPIRAAVSQMVLVEIKDAPNPAITARGRNGLISPKAETMPSASRAQSAPAQHRRPDPELDREAKIVTPNGVEAPGSSDFARQPASPVTANDGNGAGSTSGPEALTGGGGVRPHIRFRAPEVRRRWRPDYPLDAFQARKEGVVDVMVTVAADASVKEAHVYQSSGTPSLDQAAVDAIKRYLFKAAMRDGKPTQAQAIVTIEWSILASGASYSKAK